MTTFPERIEELYEEMRDRDHTIGRKRFAEMLGVRKTQLDGWLDSKVTPNIEVIKQIAKTADINILWLIGETDEREYPPFQMTGLSPEEKEDYTLLLEFLQFKHRRKMKKQLKK